MRRIAPEGEHAGVEDGVAAEAVALAYAEGPGKGALVLAPEFRPLMDGPVAAVDLRHDGKLALRGGADIELEHARILHPAVGVDPEIDVITREMLGQMRPSGQHLEGIGRMRTHRIIEIPAKRTDIGAESAQPDALFFVEADIKNGKRRQTLA